MILGYWSPLLQPWHWAIIIIVPIFFLQLIHVRVYGILFFGWTPYILIRHVTGESEYWLSMIKVVMIVLFIIVGLIYDWGGIKHHPGPVSPTLPQTSTPEINAVFLCTRVSPISTTDKRSSAASPPSPKPSSSHSTPLAGLSW